MAKTFVHFRIMVSVCEGLVRQSIEAVVAVDLQKLDTLLCVKRAWCFSISFDAATNHEDSFIGVRVRVSVRGLIKNFHLLAIPVQ